MDYTFVNAEPVSIEGKEIYPIYEEDEMYYYQAIPVPDDIDITVFKDTVMVPLESEEGDKYLMLGAGGMDCSQMIAEAFIKNGYYPPLYACRLPFPDAPDETIDACMESVRSKIRNLEQNLVYLENMKNANSK